MKAAPRADDVSRTIRRSGDRVLHGRDDRHDPLAHRRGAPPSQELTLPDLYALLRNQFGVGVVQMNHPRNRGAGERGYLNRMGREGRAYDPDKPITRPPNDLLLAPGSDGRTRAIDFDTAICCHERRRVFGELRTWWRD